MNKPTRLSIRALAKRVDRAPSVVAKWLKSGRWPFGPGPWRQSQVPAIREWMQTLRANRAAGVVDQLETPSPSDSRLERRAKIKLLIVRGKIAELELKQREGALVERTDVVAREIRQLQVCLRELMHLKEIATLVVDKNLQEAEMIIECRAREIYNNIRNADFDVDDNAAAATNAPNAPDQT